MTLKHGDKIAEIVNCPLENDPRDMKLYRLIKDAVTAGVDVKPKALNKRAPKFAKMCEGWGISTYSNLSEVLMNYNGMPPVLKERFSHVSVIQVTSETGVKYQSGDVKSHYSLFPFEDDKFLEKFKTVQKL